jgi:hypothetical protein
VSLPNADRLADDLFLVLAMCGLLLVLCLATWIARLFGFDDRE